ncbi:MAG: hypothetical protein WCL28_05695 [bacterium]
MNYKNSNELFNRLILLGLMLFSTQGFARFNHLDADRVDAEERNNTETYNDKNSYRYPRSWDDRWQDSQFGYRSSAGSLNVSRFLYDEEIMIAPNPEAKFTAAFLQSRREDLVEQTADREIRLGWAFIPGRRISILGDGDTLKEFGDMGVALTLFESKVSRLEMYYWNVDNYYKSKKSDELAHRPKDSQTVGIIIKGAKDSQGPHFSLRIENDSPLEWHYPARGFEYEYWRKSASLNAEWVVANDKRVYFETTQEQKMEHKTSLVALGASKRMLRRVSEIEVGIDQQVSEDILCTAAIQNILRHVDYVNDKQQSDSLMWQESFSPSKVRRHEWGLIVSRHGKISDHTAIQHGFYANDVLVREDAREWKTWELKYQLLFDFNLNPNTRLGVNTTWDMDQVTRDFPYSKKAPFRPWGGGDLQFQMYL